MENNSHHPAPVTTSTETPHAPTGQPPALRPGNDASDAPRFYWELDGPERITAQELALEDEGYLANDLNRGRALLALREEYESCPTVVTVPAADTDQEVYVDAISSILQVAAWHGLDVEEIMDVALRTQQSVYAHSASAAAARESRVSSRSS